MSARRIQSLSSQPSALLSATGHGQFSARQFKQCHFHSNWKSLVDFSKCAKKLRYPSTIQKLIMLLCVFSRETLFFFWGGLPPLIRYQGELLERLKSIEVPCDGNGEPCGFVRVCVWITTWEKFESLTYRKLRRKDTTC